MGRKQLNRKLADWQFLRHEDVPSKGWLRAIRTGLCMTAVALAKRLGVTPATVADLEQSEVRGTITLNSLRKVAAAMDCELVYAVVPRTSLDDVLKRRATEKANAMLGRVEQTMKLEAQSVESEEMKYQAKQLVESLLENPKTIWK